jgi:hypothetical protein
VFSPLTLSIGLDLAPRALFLNGNGMEEVEVATKYQFNAFDFIRTR